MASVFTSKSTMLQVLLALVAHHKGIVENFHETGITSEYYEFKKFKYSAAENNDNKTTFENFKTENRLIQILSDNSAMHIHSSNGLNQIYGMARIIMQSSTVNQINTENIPIRRVKQEKLKDIKLHEIKIDFFKGRKNQQWPKNFVVLYIYL